MSKNLVIVESPAKAKTIEGYLGKDFVVKSSFGHVRDLPSKDISIDIENDFKPKYVIPSDKKKLVSELKSMDIEAKPANGYPLETIEQAYADAELGHFSPDLLTEYRNRLSLVLETPLREVWA